MPLDPDLAERLRVAGEKVKTSRTETIAARDQVILEAYGKGGGVREIARAVGLSHPVVLDIIERSRT
jgi:transposase-like protein